MALELQSARRAEFYDLQERLAVDLHAFRIDDARRSVLPRRVARLRGLVVARVERDLLLRLDEVRDRVALRLAEHLCDRERLRRLLRRFLERRLLGVLRRVCGLDDLSLGLDELLDAGLKRLRVERLPDLADGVR